MRIDLEHMREGFLAVQAGKKSRHAVEDRIEPSRWQYDYLTLSRLSHDVEALVREVPSAAPGARALDLGADKSPYRDLLQSRLQEVQAMTNHLKSLVTLYRLEGSLLVRRGLEAPGAVAQK